MPVDFSGLFPLASLLVLRPGKLHLATFFRLSVASTLFYVLEVDPRGQCQSDVSSKLLLIESYFASSEELVCRSELTWGLMVCLLSESNRAAG